MRKIIDKIILIIDRNFFELLFIFAFVIFVHAYKNLNYEIISEISNSKSVNSPFLNEKEELIKKAVKEFENEAYFRGIDIDASYLTFNIQSNLNQYGKNSSQSIEDGSTVLGVCHGLGHINYRDSLFEEGSYPQLRQVVFHELGHCLWDLKHNAKESPDIMSEYAFDWNAEFKQPNAEIFWNQQVDKFFNEIKKNESKGLIFRINQKLTKLKYKTFWNIKNRQI